MLARLRVATARAAHTATVHPFSSLGLFRFAIRPPSYAAATRACHVATGKFSSLEPDGTLVMKDVSIRVGDPGEAYVLIPKEVGYALQASGHLTNTLSKRSDRFALSYFHDTQHFALGKCPLSDVCLLLTF